MKEILYIQAGTQANYIGTHFWNTQESYFTCEDEGDLVDHGISFREGLNQKSEPTFCPRLLAFDNKGSQFGTLSETNALFGMDASADGQTLWSGNAVECMQEPVSKSQYQIDMEDSDMNAGYASSAAIQPEDVRYWSDFNRMFYVPRTIQKVPDIPEWEEAEGNWTGGHEMFTRYDEETGLMEGPLRLFLEECETTQGIQLIHDTSTFGSFVDALLASVRDDFAKLPLFSLPLLSDVTPSKSVDNPLGVRKLVNDALAMRSLSEMCSMSVPIQSPTTWTDEVCSNKYMHANKAHTYHTSAILSAHIETATLPLRLNAAKYDILAFSAQLSWRSGVPFAELSGAFPEADAMELGYRIHNFSSSTPSVQFGRHDVTRGFSTTGMTFYNERLSSVQGAAVSRYSTAAAPSIQSVLSWFSSTHAAAYPLPTSFPAFFSSAEANLPQGGPSGILSRPRSTSVFSSVGVASGASNFFSDYARFLDRSIRRKVSVETCGIGLDEMRDLANDLWTLHDNAGGQIDLGPDVRGEDED
ncbi:Protein dml-1 [Mycena sanguinolenta]|uniref:Protein dml-1 n=1 Tax=Mycena sanguinolenta TaxID=230812 RepID=A0A8H6YEA8_9AGAR|nr:Protein dml-1 [Mycena sanguinolenta]